MHLAENVMHFARILRGAGLPVGPDRVLDALRALQISGLRNREDFYWTLASIFLDRREQFDLYDQAFHVFWRDRAMLDRVIALGSTLRPVDPNERPLSSRLADSLAANRPGTIDRDRPPELEVEALLTVSDRERLQKADFDSMTTAELAQAKQLLAGLRLPIPLVTTRRKRPDPHGPEIDLRDTLRASARGNADLIPLRRRAMQRRHPPLTILCDISGSMSRYSRMFLHFVHAITNDRDRVHTFLFGTRLTNVTRHFRHRDVDVALNAVVTAVDDWSGGTRIGQNLHEFNQRWSRRVLGQNAVVLLITDGLDREGGDELPAAMERLHKSCRRLIWLNPLLRSEQFQPLARGVRQMLPHVDAFLPVHNVESLRDLGRALEQTTHENRVRSRSQLRQ
jgi:uncharacterized protein with von Willebrand factor type A (vWA) domain